MNIYCCECKKKIEARLTNGSEIYPHRKDLFKLSFWKCDICHNYVGCHHKTDKPTQPLGVIPSEDIRKARKHLHELIDPIWMTGDMSRKKLYSAISDKLGRKYHAANVRSVEEAREAYKAVLDIKRDQAEDKKALEDHSQSD